MSDRERCRNPQPVTVKPWRGEWVDCGECKACRPPAAVSGPTRTEGATKMGTATGQAILSAQDRLRRITGMHSKEVTAGGMTSGDCNECGWNWPCPTYRWATEVGIDMACTWDLSECSFEEHRFHEAPDPAGFRPATAACSAPTLNNNVGATGGRHG